MDINPEEFGDWCKRKMEPIPVTEPLKDSYNKVANNMKYTSALLVMGEFIDEKKLGCGAV